MTTPTPTAAAPRVLLIEDDESLQRFVAMALEEIGVDLLAVISVDEGLAALRAGRFSLVISDLMLPGRSGLELIAELEAEPDLLGGSRLVIFSAGLRPKVRQQLQTSTVWRLLSKPCSLAELEACVREGMALAGAGSTAQVGLVAPAQGAAELAEQDAINRFFGGKANLFYSFRAGCLLQFKADQEAGDQACSAADLVALRYLAHSLKSVLLTLGRADDSVLAKALEDACAGGDVIAAPLLWSGLRQVLRSLAAGA
jgi:CheY-like chemotaxis protein